MRFVEAPYYNLIGIRKEFDELNPVSALFMKIGAIGYTSQHHCVIEGYPLPKFGAAIVTGNHNEEANSYEAAVAGLRVRRLIRTVVKKSLVVRGAYESDEYLESIGEKKNSLEYNPLKAFVMKGIGVIPILRHNPGVNFARICFKVLDSSQLLGMFMQDTRDEGGLLRNLKMGVAHLASMDRYRNTPIYEIAFSETSATVLEPITYNQMLAKIREDEPLRDVISSAEITINLADRLADTLPQRVQEHWKATRNIELARLVASVK